MRQHDIHKAAGILIRGKKLLVERSKGKKFFIAPGGSVEEGESVEQALVRELVEEFQIETDEKDFGYFDTFYAAAAGQEHKVVRMDVYRVSKWKGEPTADSEVEEVAWIDSSDVGEIAIGSIFEKEVIPRLASEGLIG